MSVDVCVRVHLLDLWGEPSSPSFHTPGGLFHPPFPLFFLLGKVWRGDFQLGSPSSWIPKFLFQKSSAEGPSMRHWVEAEGLWSPQARGAQLPSPVTGLFPVGGLDPRMSLGGFTKAPSVQA